MRDVRVLVDPMVVFRDRLTAADAPSWWQPWIRALAIIGCAVSLFASGRLSAVLLLDGMVSALPLVGATMAGVAVAYRSFADAGSNTSMRRVLAASAVGMTPWLVWWWGVLVIGAVVPPISANVAFRALEVAALVPLVWCAWIDLSFFRVALGRLSHHAALALIVQRIVAWSATALYYVAMQARHELWPTLARWLTEP